MKRKIMLLLALAMSILSVNAQEKGISFLKPSNWNEVLQEAKKENKFIFVDCFATWCGPCKEMDRDVYSDEKVGDFFNAHFINVKVQMDSTKNDDPAVRRWYADAKYLLKKFVVLNGGVSYPTFLFFDSSGKIVHRFLGALAPPDFINLGKDALNENQQYYTLKDRFRQHNLTDTLKPYLAIRAKLLGETKLADSVGSDYVTNYLLKLPPDELYTIVNFTMLDRFTTKMSDPGYQLMLKHPTELGKVVNDPFYVDKKKVRIILNNYVQPETKNKIYSEVNWPLLQSKYEKRFGRFGKLAVLQQKLFTAWNEVDKAPKSYDAAFLDYFKNVGELNAVELNNVSWLIFLHSSNPEALNVAINVIKPHKDEDAQAMDTYANLLYKVGRKNDAITQEQKAVDYEDAHPSNHFANTPDPVYQTTLNKMKKGEKTW